MKFVNLRSHAYVNGVLRSPSEGSLHLTDEEAERLIENELADDVTKDFPSEAVKGGEPAKVTTTDGKPPKA